MLKNPMRTLAILIALFIASAVHAASLDEMLGQMVLVGFRGTGEAPLAEDLVRLREDIRDGKVGGIVLFEPDYTTKSVRNIVSLDQTKRLVEGLQAIAPTPLFVAVDQEGGRVRRFTPGHGIPATPSAKSMGSASPESTREHARELGRLLARAGVNLDFAPVLDVDVNPGSPAIGAAERSFSPDPETVTAHAAAFAAGLRDVGLLSCFKHFPGHGSAADDSHQGFTDISKTWSTAELKPYRNLLPDYRDGMVMLGHLILDRCDPVYPASLSRAIVGGLLRSELGWRGVVVTDDMQMRAIADHYGDKDAVALAVNAGVDIILMGGNLRPVPGLGGQIHAILRELVQEGRISPDRIEESYDRIMKLKKILSNEHGPR